MKSALVLLAALCGALPLFAAEAGRTWTRIDPRWNADFHDLESAFGSLFAVGTAGAIVRRSSPSDSWAPILSPTTEDLEQLRFVNGQLFALGANGTLLSSPDGNNWTARRTMVAGTLLDLLHDGSSYLAIGTEGTILTSPDGISWAVQVSPTDSDLWSVIWTGTRYLIAGFRVFLSSVDGVNWTVNEANISPEFYTLAWDGTHYSGYHRIGATAQSEDGTDWTFIRDYDDEDMGGFDAVASGPPGTVLGLERGLVSFSPDQTAWQDAHTGLGNSIVGLVWDGGQFVAMNEQGHLAVSPDGLRWTSERVGSYPSQFYDGVWNGEQYVFVGGDGKIFNTDDLATWNSGLTGTREILRAVAWTGSFFVAVGQEGVILTSSDGVTWTRRVPNARWDFHCAYWTGSEVLVGGEDGVLLGSSNGVDWTLHHPGEISVICWDGSKFVGISERVSLHSTDAVNWTIASTIPLPITSTGGGYRELRDLIWTGSHYLAVGDRGSTYLSPDSLTWTPHHAGTNENLFNVVWNGSRFVATAGTLVHSVDGMNWIQVSGTLPGGVGALTWNGSQFLAPTRDGTISSPTGEAWTEDRETRVRDASLLAWGNGTYAALGPDGFNATSTDGLNWTGRPRIGNDDFDHVHWTGTRFLASAVLRVFSSTDGITWTETTMEGKPELDTRVHRMVQAGAKTIAILANYDVISLESGSDWKVEIRRGLDGIITEFASGNGVHLASVSNDVAISTDGINWTRHPLSFSSVRHVQWDGRRYVGLASSSLVESADGINWTVVQTNGLGGNLDALLWTGTRYLVWSRTRLRSSINGIDWNIVHTISSERNGFTMLQNGDTILLVGNILLRSDDGGMTWAGEIPAQTRLDWNDVTASPGAYVTVGADGAVATSTDLLNWTLQRVDPPLNFESVLWSGDRFLAFGEGEVLQSADGADWTQFDPVPGFAVSDALSNDGQLLAVGEDSSGLLETGARWIRGDLRISGALSVTANDHLFVAGGERGALSISPSGRRWTPVPGENLHGVAWNGTRYVAVGEFGAIFTSLDGISWQPVKQGGPTDPDLLSVVWAAGQFVAVGEGTTETSPDGLTWSARALSGQALRDLVWTGFQFLAVGDRGRIETSPDGRAWTTRSPGTTEYLSGVAAGPSRLVAVGRQGTILYSTDGISWLPAASITVNGLTAVEWIGDRFLAVGAGGTTLSSPDGIDWSFEQTGIDAREEDGRAMGLDSNGTAYLAGSRGGIYRELAPNDWELIKEPITQETFTRGIESIDASSPRLVAVGWDGLILSRAPGESSWHQQQGFSQSNSVHDLCWAGDRFVGVAGSAMIFTSPDGLDWRRWSDVSTPGRHLYGCAWSGCDYVAVGTAGLIAHSNDAENWEQISPLGSEDLNDVAWTGAEFLAVGEDGIILYSSPDSAEFARYLLWAEAMGLHGLERDPLADPDGDGCNNLFELAFGTDPVRADRKDPELSANITGDAVTLSLRRPRAVPGIRYLFEISRDLRMWERSDLLRTTTTIEDLGDGSERYQVILSNFDPLAEPQLYARILIELGSAPPAP